MGFYWTDLLFIPCFLILVALSEWHRKGVEEWKKNLRKRENRNNIKIML